MLSLHKRKRNPQVVEMKRGTTAKAGSLGSMGILEEPDLGSRDWAGVITPVWEWAI